MRPALHPTSHRRRWLLPVLVIAIAAALMLWNRWQQRFVADAIAASVTQICGDISAGKNLAGQLNPDDPFSEKATLTQIKQVIDRATADKPLRITLPVATDRGIRGKADTATHTVMLQLGGEGEGGGVDELGLRVRYDPKTVSIRVLGYWLPQSTVTK